MNESRPGRWPIRTWLSWLILGGLLSFGSARAAWPAASSAHSINAATAATGVFATSATPSASIDEAVSEEIIDPLEDLHDHAAAQSVGFLSVTPEASISVGPRPVSPIPAAVVESAEARGPPSA